MKLMKGSLFNVGILLALKTFQIHKVKHSLILDEVFIKLKLKIKIELTENQQSR